MGDPRQNACVTALPATQTRVFLDEVPWDMRSRNTDWRYVRFDLPQLARFEPSLQMVQQQSPWITLRENLRTIRNAGGRRIGWPPVPGSGEQSTLSQRELARSRADVVFSHRGFPMNAGATPVVWQRPIVEHPVKHKHGHYQTELQVRGPLFHRAAFVQVHTASQARRHAQLFPDIAERFVSVPFFLPYVHACEEVDLQRHTSDGPVRILFVGNHAARKGLDLLFTAFTSLPAETQRDARLTVISHFDRSRIAVPQNEQIELLSSVPVARVMEEMRRAHILVNVARFETYGLVFIEAMSQGTVCLGPDEEVQRDLLGVAEGETTPAGLNLPCHADPIRFALQALIHDPQRRAAMARAAWLRFGQRYAPEIVARQYAELFRRAAGTERAR